MLRGQGLRLRFGAGALKCKHGPSKSHRSWVASVALPEVVCAFPRESFRMQAQPFKVPHNTGMLCCTPRGSDNNPTILKNPSTRIISSPRRHNTCTPYFFFGKCLHAEFHKCQIINSRFGHARAQPLAATLEVLRGYMSLV